LASILRVSNLRSARASSSSPSVSVDAKDKREDRLEVCDSAVPGRELAGDDWTEESEEWEMTESVAFGRRKRSLKED
jgi:hypothetical protein